MPENSKVPQPTNSNINFGDPFYGQSQDKVETHNYGNGASLIQVSPKLGVVEQTVTMPQGNSYCLAADGSIYMGTAKQNNDHNTGRFDINSQGSTRFKIGESLLIEVGNKNNITISQDGDATKNKAMSIIVHGNIDITSTGGEVNVGGKNIQFFADNEINFNAPKISINAGEGKGKNQDSKTSSGATIQAPSDYGGVVNINAGTFTSNVGVHTEISSVKQQVTSDHTSLIPTDKGNHGIATAGSATFNIGGDLQEIIKGSRKTNISANSDPTTSILNQQLEGWLINLQSSQSAGTTGSVVPKSSFSIQSGGSGGGMNFSTTSGDVNLNTNVGNVDLKTLSGFWALTNGLSTLGGFPGKTDKYPNVNQGVYLQSLNQAINISSNTEIKISVNDFKTNVEQATIDITANQIDIQNPKGIYLN
jgi:hypothetical protein